MMRLKGNPNHSWVSDAIASCQNLCAATVTLRSQRSIFLGTFSCHKAGAVGRQCWSAVVCSSPYLCQ